MGRSYDNWDDSISNEALIDGKVVPYDACGVADDEIELAALKQSYSKAWPVYLGYGQIHSVQKVRQYGMTGYHFFKRAD